MSDDKKTRSLLEKHRRIAFPETDGRQDGDTQREAAFVESLSLKPLNLPARRPKRSGMIYGAVMVAAAASAIFVLGRRPDSQDDDLLSPKGADRVRVYWERDGKVSPLEKGVDLLDNDRVRTEIVSTTGGTAYQVISSRDGRFLLPSSEILNSALPLTPGTPLAFKGSIKLLPPNEGESLTVIVCRDCVLTAAELEDVTQGRRVIGNKTVDLFQVPLR